MKNKPLLTIFLIVFIDLLGFGIILPLLPFIAEKYKGNAFQIGLLTSAYSFFQLIAAPLLGRLSDRYGRKKLLLLSQAGSVIGYIILGFANSLPLLFLGRIIDGITGGNISIAQAYIADVTKKEERAKGMGLIGAAFGMGFIFGPAVGGLLARWSLSLPAFFAAAVGVVTVLSTYFFLEETVDVKKATHSPKTAFSWKELKKILTIYPIGLLILGFFLHNTAFSILQGNFALWTEKTFRFGPVENGWLFTYIGVLIVFVHLRILPYLTKRFKESLLLKTATLILSLGLFFLVTVQSVQLVYVFLTFIALGNGLSNPVIQALASENISKEEQGGALGILQSAGSLGRIIGPIIGGLLFFQFGHNIPFIFAGAIMFVVFGYLVVKLK